MQLGLPCGVAIRGTVDLSAAQWQTSAHSASNVCVEIAFVDNRVAVRDSKYRDVPVLPFNPTEWEAFLRGVNDGQFRLPNHVASVALEGRRRCSSGGGSSCSIAIAAARLLAACL